MEDYLLKLCGVLAVALMLCCHWNVIHAEFNAPLEPEMVFCLFVLNRDTLELLVLFLGCQISVEIPDVTTLNYSHLNGTRLRQWELNLGRGEEISRPVPVFQKWLATEYCHCKEGGFTLGIEKWTVRGYHMFMFYGTCSQCWTFHMQYILWKQASRRRNAKTLSAQRENIASLLLRL